MAGYVVPVKSGIDIFKKLIEVIRAYDLGKFIDKGDPSSEDIIRLKLISESLDVVRGRTVTDFDAFEGLLDAAKKMKPAELKRTIAGTKATVLRGQAVLKPWRRWPRKPNLGHKRDGTTCVARRYQRPG